MSERQKLQRAVETTIAAGYQLDREAFEFLTTIAAKDDPEAVIRKALEEIQSLEEKPMFIDKETLEKLTLETEPNENAKEEQETTHSELSSQIQRTPEISVPSTERGHLFRPFAKDIESHVNIVEDPSAKLSSNGTMDEYLQYFQDRFKRLEKLLRQRMDVKAATPILEALKSQPKTKLKIIGMVTEKRESKQQKLITIEDLQASATILVSAKAPEEVQNRAQTLLPDQVICAAVTKTRGHLFIAEDIILPEVGQKSLHRAKEQVYAVLTSDLHVGSTKFNKDAFKRFILWLQGKYGNEQMLKIAERVKYVLIAGDIVDGVGVFPGQAKELRIRDVHRQYKYALSLLKKIPEYIEIIVNPGNHDAPRKALPQPAISEDYLPTPQGSRRIYSLGNPCTVSIHGVEVLMYHGRSLDDVIGTVPGTDQEHPERAMKLLLQGRHVAPVYGGKTTIAPENRDFMVIDRVPDIFQSGHTHVMGVCNHRGVLVVNSGGWQEQTDYMAKLGLVPTPGKVPVVNLQTMEMFSLNFNQT